MSEPNPIDARRRFGLDDLKPAHRAPWWRRLLPALVLSVPAFTLLILEFRELFSGPVPGGMSPWTGVAFCALWLHLLLRVIVPLARAAWWLDGGIAALAAVALLRWLDAGAGWTIVTAVLAAIVMLALRRPRARTSVRVAVPQAPPVTPTSAVAFSETATNTSRAALVALGCAAFLVVGIGNIVFNGPIGWWYVLASLVWLTGSLPWMLRVTLGRGGFTVRSLLLPGSLVRIPLTEVADVTAGVATMRDWGGRGTVVEDGVTSILRGDGAALLVTRTDGTQVVVNVERPDEAIAVFRALRPGAAPA